MQKSYLIWAYFWLILGTIFTVYLYWSAGILQYMLLVAFGIVLGRFMYEGITDWEEFLDAFGIVFFVGGLAIEHIINKFVEWRCKTKGIDYYDIDRFGLVKVRYSGEGDFEKFVELRDDIRKETASILKIPSFLVEVYW